MTLTGHRHRGATMEATTPSNLRTIHAWAGTGQQQASNAATLILPDCLVRSKTMIDEGDLHLNSVAESKRKPQGGLKVHSGMAGSYRLERPIETDNLLV